MKRNSSLVTFLLLAVVISLTLSPVQAEKGSAKGKDVWWVKHGVGGDVSWKAIIYETGSGIIHEWRYEVDDQPCNIHMLYKPVEKFVNEPKGAITCWMYDPEIYKDLPDADDEADLIDFFDSGEEYWIQSNYKPRRHNL